MSRKTVTAALAGVLAVCLANEAMANPQLTFGPSPGVAYTAGQLGTPGHINFLSSGFTTPVFDGAFIGSANWGPTSISGTLITATSNFTLIGVESLTVSIGGKTATGNVSWTLDKDPPFSVNLLTGTWHITSSNLANFGAGSDNFLDITALGSGPDMVALSQIHGANELLTVSSGEAISSIIVGNGVPEPAPLALLGVGLCGLGLIRRWHIEIR